MRDKSNFWFETDNLYFIRIDKEHVDKYIELYSDKEIQSKLFKKEYNSKIISTYVNNKIFDKKALCFSIFEISAFLHLTSKFLIILSKKLFIVLFIKKIS